MKRETDAAGTGPVVVVTGGTRGIGRGLCLAFHGLGCRVVVSGRRRLDAVRAAREMPGSASAVCDTTRSRDPERLSDFAVRRFGSLDIWINNAGRGQPWLPVHECGTEVIESLIRTNLTGLVLGSRAAARTMIRQGRGLIANMNGFGSNGSVMKRLVLYGLSKRGVQYFTRGLAAELRGSGVAAGTINPGMVATDFLRAPFEGRRGEFAKAKKIFNILSSPVDEVAPWLARKILSAWKSRRNGFAISYTGPFKILARFALAPFRRRKFFD